MDWIVVKFTILLSINMMWITPDMGTDIKMNTNIKWMFDCECDSDIKINVVLSLLTYMKSLITNLK
jgi:hypothetical protein